MDQDATRRTHLASERTQLAWWRTGLTALAVALGVGRIVPALDDSLVQWPYVTLGVAFALYGVALIWFGTVRGEHVERAVEEGGFAAPSPAASKALAGTGVFLGVVTAMLIGVG